MTRITALEANQELPATSLENTGKSRYDINKLFADHPEHVSTLVAHYKSALGLVERVVVSGIDFIPYQTGRENNFDGGINYFLSNPGNKTPQETIDVYRIALENLGKKSDPANLSRTLASVIAISGQAPHFLFREDFGKERYKTEIEILQNPHMLAIVGEWNSRIDALVAHDEEEILIQRRELSNFPNVHARTAVEGKIEQLAQRLFDHKEQQIRSYWGDKCKW